MSSDASDCSVLVLLDLSSAFDTVDRHVLIKSLREWVGISGTALHWFTSYLTDKSFSVSFGHFVSDLSPPPTPPPPVMLFRFAALGSDKQILIYCVSFICR